MFNTQPLCAVPSLIVEIDDIVHGITDLVLDMWIKFFDSPLEIRNIAIPQVFIRSS